MNRLRQRLMQLWGEVGGFALGLVIGAVLTWGAMSFLYARSGDVAKRNAAAHTDTIVEHDTLRITQPSTTGRDTIIRRITARLPIRTDTTANNHPPPPDTADVIMPITQRIYADSTYKVWVSGYLPKLDSMHVYQRTEYVTTTTQAAPRRWNVGIQLGYGITPKGAQPYLGFGITYKLF